ncbi:MAG: phosphate ABC transporter substrate-binding protein PstS [Polyangia bacterium]|nr:phosphate ABC transporter substrate-binding protein PstS [Polyangia bacterium]
MCFGKLGIFGAALAVLAGVAQGVGCKGSGGSARRINGAGASFPYPLYSQWAHAYQKKHGLQINYQSIGSGGGIAQIKAGTVDFGASDEPLKLSELEAAGLTQFPLVMGGVVPVVNVPGIKAGQLKLSPELLADIYLGKVTRWDAQPIKQLNPGMSLPDKAITVVYRADGSGTTWIFTSYLSKISSAWKEKVGSGKAVKWPVGVGGKGNEGVAAYMGRLDGAIGYVEFAYALKNNIAHARLRNSAGRYVQPTIESFQAAAVNADWKAAPGFYLVLIDQPGNDSWPITGASFILVHRNQKDVAKAKAMLRFFDWCFARGQKQAEALHYVPMPDAVADLVRETWRREITAGGKPVWK